MLKYLPQPHYWRIGGNIWILSGSSHTASVFQSSHWNSFEELQIVVQYGSNFEGTIDVLTHLTLTNLNVAYYNQFIGWVPTELQNVNIEKVENLWDIDPPPPSTHDQAERGNLTCPPSAVSSSSSIKPGLGLSGILPMVVANITSLNNLDMSYNRLGDHEPFYLPPNLKRLNLAGCDYAGKFPVSILAAHSLEYLIISHSHIIGGLADIFGYFPALATLDVGFNLLTRILPKSMRLLSHMAQMYCNTTSLKEQLMS